MLDKIGLNHILSFDTFCICLLCKKCILQNNNFVKENLICTHLESEEHESNCKALFKLCVPDPSCESDEIKYVDILRNLEFDISWEIGNEASYVCKRDNNLWCVLCQEVVSETRFEDKQKLELTLASHLNCDFHLNLVKSKASWIHHPSKDHNYIAFHNSLVFCSYCQNYLKSPKNTLLQVAADHIATDLENMIQIKAMIHQRDSAVEDVCEDTLSISDEIEDYNQQTSEIRSVEIFDDHCNSHQTRLLGMDDIFVQIYKICKPCKTPCKLRYRYQTPYNENAEGLQIVGIENVTNKTFLRTLNGKVFKDLLNHSSLIKLNGHYIEVKSKMFFCKVCQVLIHYDEKNGQMLKRHLSTYHNDLLVQRASDFMKTIGRGSKVAGLNEKSDKFCLIKNQIAMDKKFVSHLMFIENNGQYFVCILCKDVITFTTCGKHVKTHFFKTDHLKKTYEVSVNTNLANKIPDQHSKAITKNKKSKGHRNKTFKLFEPQTKKVEKTNTSSSSQLDSEVSVRLRSLLKALRLLESENKEFKMNSQFLTIQDDSLFCTVCQSLMILKNCRKFYSKALRHCFSQSHNEILIKSATDYVKLNNLKQAVSDSTLQHFFELVKKVTENDPHDVTASHLMFLIPKTDHNFSNSPSMISCHLCNESIEFSVYGVEEHFLSIQHRKKTYELNCKRVSDSSITKKCVGSKPAKVLLADVLYKVSTKCEEVQVNQLFISFTENKFFCSICQEIPISSVTGSFLKLHCLTERHNKILLNNALSYKLRLKNELSSEEDKRILSTSLADITKRKPYDKITSHVQFLTVKEKQLFCLLCRQHIDKNKTSDKSMTVLKHFQSYFHGVKVYALNFSIFSTSTMKSERYISTQPFIPNTRFAACAIVGKIRKRKSSKKSSQDKVSEKPNRNNDKVLTSILKNLPDDLKELGSVLELADGTLHCGLCNYKLVLKTTLYDDNELSTIIEHSRTHLSAYNVEQMIGSAAFNAISTANQQCIKTNIDHLQLDGADLYCCICILKLFTLRKGRWRNIQISSFNKIVGHLNSKCHREHLINIQS